jgi:hypothetical protein
MTKHINHGTFDYINGTYKKYVQFNQAVLWMTRQLSVPLEVMDRVKKYNIHTMLFIDLGKKEQWKFKSEKVQLQGEMKKVGQEKQWYFRLTLQSKAILRIYCYIDSR